MTYSQLSRTVYFLKDHLGSIRATVLDSATVPVRGYDDYDPWGYPLAGRTKKTPYDSLQKIAKNKFTGKEWDDDYSLNWYDSPFRDYDPQIGRWMSVDPLAVKYPSFSPYNYAANNPLLFVDANGDTIDTSQLTKEQQKALDEALKQLLQSNKFGEIWKTLAQSKAIYKIVVNPTQEKGGLYQPKAEKTGSGGALSFKDVGSFSSSFAFSHETYHAFQHDQNYPGHVVGIEIEANLFANAVSNDLYETGLGEGILFMGGGNPTFDYAFTKLQFGSSFDETAWYLANTRFLYSGFNTDRRYNAYGIKIYSPLIKRFYPLIK